MPEPPETFFGRIPVHIRVAAAFLLVASASGAAGFGVGWALGQPREAGIAQAASAARQVGQLPGYPAPPEGAAVAGAAQPPGARAPGASADPLPLTMPLPPLQAPASGHAAPVIWRSVALAAPLVPVRSRNPEYERGFGAGSTTRQYYSRGWAAAAQEDIPPPHPLSLPPRPPQVYISPILATMGDVTVQIRPNRSRASLIR
jgi:hypothetical protein